MGRHSGGGRRSGGMHHHHVGGGIHHHRSGGGYYHYNHHFGAGLAIGLGTTAGRRRTPSSGHAVGPIAPVALVRQAVPQDAIDVRCADTMAMPPELAPFMSVADFHRVTTVVTEAGAAAIKKTQRFWLSLMLLCALFIPAGAAMLGVASSQATDDWFNSTDWSARLSDYSPFDLYPGLSITGLIFIVVGVVSVVSICCYGCGCGRGPNATARDPTERAAIAAWAAAIPQAQAALAASAGPAARFKLALVEEPVTVVYTHLAAMTLEATDGVFRALRFSTPDGSPLHPPQTLETHGYLPGTNCLPLPLVGTPAPVPVVLQPGSVFVSPLDGFSPAKQVAPANSAAAVGAAAAMMAAMVAGGMAPPPGMMMAPGMGYAPGQQQPMQLQPQPYPGGASAPTMPPAGADGVPLGPSMVQTAEEDPGAAPPPEFAPGAYKPAAAYGSTPGYGGGVSPSPAYTPSSYAGGYPQPQYTPSAGAGAGAHPQQQQQQQPAYGPYAGYTNTYSGAAAPGGGAFTGGSPASGTAPPPYGAGGGGFTSDPKLF